MRSALFILAVIGFFIAKYIHNQKKTNKPLICMAGFDCESVVKSSHSQMMGIPLEVFGMLYYAFMSVVYFALIFIPSSSLHDLLIIFLFTAPLLAFLFSLYLVFIQVFVLKKGCSWCFLSSFVCIAIFILTVFAYDFSAAWQGLIGF